MERCRSNLPLCIVAAVLAGASPAPLTADLWDELGTEDAQWALEQARSRIAAALAAEGNTELVPDGPDGADLPWVKWVLKEATAADWKTISGHAAELAGGEVHAAMADAHRWTRSKATEAARDALLDRLDKKSLPGKAVELVTADGDRLGKVVDALFDPRRSWESVAQLAYDEARDAAAKALPGELQQLASRGIHFALTGDTSGSAAGDAFFALVAAERQLLEAAHRKLLLTSGDEIYTAYREARRRGFGSQEAMAEIEPLLVRGVAGDLEGRDAGAYFVRSFGGAEGARAVLEACHARGESELLFCLTQTLHDHQTALAAGLRPRVTAAGEATRTHLEQAWRAVGVEMRHAAEAALGRRSDLRARLASDLSAATADLARLRDAAAAAEDLCREHAEHRESLAEYAAAIAAAQAESADLDRPFAALAECRRDAASESADGFAVGSALAELRAAETTARAERDAACDRGSTATFAAAAAAADRAERAAARAEEAASRGRERLAEFDARERTLAAAAAESPAGGDLASARGTVEAALVSLDTAREIAATWRAAFDRVREVTARAVRLSYLAAERRNAVEAGLRRWQGEGSVNDALTEAATHERRVNDCADRARLELEALEAPERRLAVESEIGLLAERRARAGALLGSCPPGAGEPTAGARGPAERTARSRDEAREIGERIDAHAAAATACASQARSAAAAMRPSAPPPPGGRAEPPGRLHEGVDTSAPGAAEGAGSAPPSPAGRAAAAAPAPVGAPPSAPFVVPELRGLSAEAAARKLAEARFEAAWAGGDPAPAADLAFTVQSQEPPAGAAAAPGSRVTVRVHSAFDPRRTVPDVVGLGAEEAARRLAAAELEAELAGGDPAPSREREFRVQDQRPAAGESADAGSRVVVRLHSRHEPRQATAPAVVGLTAADAEQRLRAAGFVPELTGGDPAPSPSAAFTVQAQEPSPGAVLPPGAAVRLRIHSAHVAAAPSPTAPAAAAGDPGSFLCPAIGAFPERRARVLATMSGLMCDFRVPGLPNLVAQVYWNRPGSSTPWDLCGKTAAVGHIPAVAAQAGQLATYSRMNVQIYGDRFRTMVRLQWHAQEPQPVPAVVHDLARRLLDEAARFAAPCDGAAASLPGSAPTSGPPAAAPASAAATSPSDTRLARHRTDVDRHRFRRTVSGVDGDPARWWRSDDGRP